MDAPAAATAAADWQFAATRLGDVPPAALAGAAAFTVAIVDTGVDLSSPDLAGRKVLIKSVIGGPTAGDPNGHGTFVASLLARSSGAATILVVKAARADGSMSASAEAAGIRYAVDHGARIISLSIAGTSTSPAERSAVAYAARHGVLLVAAAGNAHDQGDPVEYPAALLQPVGSNGHSGIGLVVGASTPAGGRAGFSSSGSWLSLAAPGSGVVAGIAPNSSAERFPRTQVAAFGSGSGTSYAAPQVAAIAALVWATDPDLTAREVAETLEQTATGAGSWNADLGYGVVDAAAAVARAQALASPGSR